MCLIVFAWKMIPACPLVLAANRDEFYARPALAADWWTDHPQIYAGRDLQGGGTWLGVNKQGRFAALTNIRNGTGKQVDSPSRGALVANFLNGELSAPDYLQLLDNEASHYSGFNLILGDANAMYWFTNQGDIRFKTLEPGLYGLSNASLDTPWPKVVRAKAEFASLLCQGAPDDAYFEMLSDTTPASDCRLPKTGVSLEWERRLSPIYIDSIDYGTRASTLVRVHKESGAQLEERIIS